MSAQPSPIRRRGERNLYCPNYGHCLDMAVEKKWRSFSCSECGLKGVQEDIPAVRTVNDSNIVYELPRSLPQAVWYSIG
ncbi:MAG: hypothetical protein JRI36_11330 [Deltaproteobacteria bacterium]|nr:hypothetical protein [Deltaproteobacteria bacterium]